MEKITDYMFSESDSEYEKIVHSHKKLIYGLVMSHLKNMSDVEDIVQETFIDAYFQYGRLQDKTKLSSWLCGIARNKSLKHIRKYKREVLTDFDEFDMISDESETNPENSVIYGEDIKALYSAINELSSEMKETVLLHYISEKSISEISDILNIKEGTVKSRLHQARMKLKGEYYNMDRLTQNIEENPMDKIIKESIKIAKGKLKELETAEKHDWWSYLSATDDVKRVLSTNNIRSTEADALLVKSYEQGIDAMLKKEDFAGVAVMYDMYADFEYNRRIGDYGRDKNRLAAEYSEKAGDFECAARFRGNMERIDVRRKAERTTGKDLLYYYAGAATLIKVDTAVLPAGNHHHTNSDSSPSKFYDTSLQIMGMIYPLFDSKWERRNFYEYNDTLLENFFPFDTGVLKFRVITDAKREDITIGDKEYKGCFPVFIKPEIIIGELKQYRVLEHMGAYKIWYAPDIGIVRVIYTSHMDQRITLNLMSHHIEENSENISGSNLFPLSLGNWWVYRSEGDNIADSSVYEHGSKFTVTHINGDNATVSQIGWAYEK